MLHQQPFFSPVFFLRRGSSSRLSRYTFRSTNTDCISLGRSPKQFQPRSAIQSSILYHRGSSTELFPFTKHVLYAWEAVPETFCFHDQAIEAEIFRSGEVATQCREIFKSQCYELCQAPYFL